MRARGVRAWSCDLLPTARPSRFHIVGDVREIMAAARWGAFIFFPPCTYLNAAGLHWNSRGRGWKKTFDALRFVRGLIEAAGERPWALENPVGLIGTRIRPASQFVQPYEFGDDASKKTGLWLHGLPLLTPTKRFAGRWVEWPKGSGKMVERWGNQTDSGQNRLPDSKGQAHARSVTFPGIADAMAEQWGEIFKKCQL